MKCLYATAIVLGVCVAVTYVLLLRPIMNYDAKKDMQSYVEAIDTALHQRFASQFWNLVNADAWRKPRLYPEIKSLCSQWHEISPLVQWPNSISFDRLCNIYKKVHDRHYYALVKV